MIPTISVNIFPKPIKGAKAVNASQCFLEKHIVSEICRQSCIPASVFHLGTFGKLFHGKDRLWIKSLDKIYRLAPFGLDS